MVGYGLGRAFVEMAGALVDRDGGHINMSE